MRWHGLILIGHEAFFKDRIMCSLEVSGKW